MSETATKILDSAQELAQKRGFNAFSYADISKEIGIKTASIHYHFPSKADLGTELISRYKKSFAGELERVDERNSDSVEKLKGYIKLYHNTLMDDRMCLCGMLASDVATLPEQAQVLVGDFFTENEKWLSRMLQSGRDDGVFDFQGDSDEYAQFVLSSIQGALLISRALKSEHRFNQITGELISTLLVKV